MKRLFLQLFNKFRHLILYGIIGGMSSGLDFLLYTALVEFVGLNYMLANCISVLAGILVSVGRTGRSAVQQSDIVSVYRVSVCKRVGFKSAFDCAGGFVAVSP